MQPMRYCSPVTVPTMVCHAPPMQFFTRRPPSLTILENIPSRSTTPHHKKEGGGCRIHNSVNLAWGAGRSMHHRHRHRHRHSRPHGDVVPESCKAPSTIARANSLSKRPTTAMLPKGDCCARDCSL